MLFNVTDIELDDEDGNFNTNRPNVIAAISIDNEFIDAVWRSKIEIPISPANQVMQIVIKENSGEQRKLGSLSINIQQFLDLEKNRTYSHWVTLFDYIEDDEYDGDLGYDDEERPRAYIRYGLEGLAEAKKNKTLTKQVRKVKEERKGSSKIVTTTKTTTYSISSASRYRQQDHQDQEELNAPEPEPEMQEVVQREVAPQQTYQENIEKYSVRVLEGDLRADTKELIHELQDQQSEIFQQEGYRVKTVSNLDKLHKELTGEHIQDQVSYFRLTRNKEDI